jgi:hypothetical protein
MADLTVANTILEQLGGGGRLKAMTGANTFIGHGSDDKREGGLTFRLPGGGGFCKDGINLVQIDLRWNDTYTVTFSRIRGSKITEVHKLDDVYCDMLMDIFEKYTGLYLTLAARR